MFSVGKVTTWILMLRGTHMRAQAQNVRRKYTPDDREVSYRGLLRDVILGSFTVMALSLAVPAWIIQVEYSKTYGRAPEPGPVAEVLRERTLDVVTPRLPRVLELAEQIVRREAAGRETARREAERRIVPDSPITAINTDVHVEPAAAQAAETVPSAINSRQTDFRESVQAP